MPGFVYMLRCADDSLYVGSTRNLTARLLQHQIGEGAAYTRDRLPVELIWHEEYEKVSHAFAREKQVQKWGRAKRLALVAGDYEGLLQAPPAPVPGGRVAECAHRWSSSRVRSPVVE